jgi:hypothetical protein
MEIREFTNGMAGIISTPEKLLDMALDGLLSTQNTIKALEEINAEDLHFKDFYEKEAEYKQLVYDLQLACGIDPDETKG